MARVQDAYAARGGIDGSFSDQAVHVEVRRSCELAVCCRCASRLERLVLGVWPLGFRSAVVRIFECGQDLRRGCSNWAWADPPPPGWQVTSSFTSSVKRQQILMLMLSRAVPDQFPVSVSGFHEGVQS